jgi:hypothetical protein
VREEAAAAGRVFNVGALETRSMPGWAGQIPAAAAPAGPRRQLMPA